MQLLLTIHGIHTLGEWQNTIHPLLTGREGLIHFPYNYGTVNILETLFPYQRERYITGLYRKYCEMRALYPGVIPSVIAHSFGTYLVSQILLRYPEVEFDRVVLCGTIIHRDYDWVTLVEKSKVRLIRNERALDAVTLLAYLRAVSSNVLSSHWSKRRRNELSLDQLLEEDPGLVHSESERTSLHEMEEDFANLTNGLTDNDRKLLRYLVNGYSLGEAAEGLGISYSAAGVRLHRLRRRLLGRSARRGE